MKKIIFTIGVALIIFCSACNTSISNSNNASERRITNTNSSETEADIRVTNSTEYTKEDLHLAFDATIDETVIIDEADIKVTALSLSYTEYSAELELKLENNSDKDLNFLCETLGYSYNSINGYMISDGYFNEEVPAGNSKNVISSFSLEDMTFLGFTNVAEIGIGIEVSDNDNTYYESGEISIKTSAAENFTVNNTFSKGMDGEIIPYIYEYTIDKSSRNVYSQDNIEIESVYVITNKNGKKFIMAEVFNNSDNTIYANTYDFYLNDSLAYDGIWSQDKLLPGKRAVIDIDLSRVMKDYDETTVAQNIAFTVKIKTSSGDEKWASEISISLDSSNEDIGLTKSRKKENSETQIDINKTLGENTSTETEQSVNKDVNTEVSSDSNTVFQPQDVSDTTIESIKTYGDYLIMYHKITDDYLANYEKALKGTILYDETAFRQMKDEMEKSFEEQEQQYGAMKNSPIMGKDTIVNYLKSYRDSLKSVVDSYEETLKLMR